MESNMRHIPQTSNHALTHPTKITIAIAMIDMHPFFSIARTV